MCCNAPLGDGPPAHLYGQCQRCVCGRQRRSVGDQAATEGPPYICPLCWNTPSDSRSSILRAGGDGGTAVQCLCPQRPSVVSRCLSRVRRRSVVGGRPYEMTPAATSSSAFSSAPPAAPRMVLCASATSRR